jgi:hypothetical protein
MATQIFKKHGMNIMASKPISMEYIMNSPISNTNIEALQIAMAKPYYCLNGCTNLQETLYVHDVTSAHLN